MGCKRWEGSEQPYINLLCYMVTTAVPQLEPDGLRFSFPLGQFGRPF